MAETRKAAKSLRASVGVAGHVRIRGSGKVMLEVMIRCWVDKKVPTDWTKFCMITLEKKRQPFLAVQLPRHVNFRNFLKSERFHIES